MVDNFFKRAGQYTLDAFRIYKYENPSEYTDIRLIIHEWELVESMDSGHLYGHATVYDSGNLLDEFLESGIVGEELGLIAYTDWFTNRTTPLNVFIYAVTDVKEQNKSNETYRSYKLHFVSIEKFQSQRRYVRRSFGEGLISDYAQTVFNDYFNATTSLIIEETSGKQTLVVPNYTPEETMHFFARKAYSSVNDTQTFRFFQNRNNFFFCTHEFLYDRTENPIKYIKINEGDQTPEGQVALTQSIVDIEFPLHVNTIDDMNKGAFYHRVTELDILNRSAITTDYEYLNEYSDYKLPDGAGNVRSKHSPEFVYNNMRFFVRDNLVVRDYFDADSQSALNAYVRPNTHYPDIYNKKPVNFHHHKSQSVTLKAYGRNDVVAGSIIELELIKPTSKLTEREIDELRSGRYLVESIRNVFHEEMYYQIMTISKSGFKGTPEAPETNNNEVILV